MKRILLLAVALFLMSFGPAFADMFTFDFTSLDNSFTAVGTLTGSNNGDGTFTITSGEGTANGVSFTLFPNPNPPNVVWGNARFNIGSQQYGFTFDNQFYPGTNQLLNNNGLLFSTNTPAGGPLGGGSGYTEINIFANGAGAPYTYMESNTVSINGNFTASAVPVPPSMLLLAPGLLGLVGIRKRFKA